MPKCLVFSILMFLSAVTAFAQKDVLVIQTSIPTEIDPWISILEEDAISFDLRSVQTLDTLSALLNYKVILYPDNSVNATGRLTETRKHNILEFIKNHNSFYIQSDYQPTLETNIYFRELSDSLGGTFEWTTVLEDFSYPVVSAPFSNYSYTVSEVYNLYYPLSGSYDGTVVKPFLIESGNAYAFYIDPSNTEYGKVVTLTDRDFFSTKSSVSDMLLKNIVLYMIGNSGLPVELSHFSAIQNVNSISLNWSTASESNNYGFEVEVNPQSPATGTTQWEKTGFVAGKGTTTEKQNYHFSVKSNQLSGTYQFRLKQIDTDGKFMYSNVLTVNLTPSDFTVNGNYPNPFNPTTNFRFDLPKAAHVKIVVSNILGQQVAVAADRDFTAGTNINVPFNGAGLASGLYYYTISVENKSITKTMMLVK